MKYMNAQTIKEMAASSNLFLFFDYDGTLVPIAARPNMARISSGNRRVLLELSKQKGVQVGVISGRSLEDIKKCVGISTIIYAGNHGLEWEKLKIKSVHPSAIAFRRVIKPFIPRLRHAYAFLHEVLVEDKIFSISVHYRQLPEGKVEFAKMILLKEIGSLLSRSQAILAEGKKVWEIRPPTEWNKGQIVLWLLENSSELRQQEVLPVYIGDDITDEDAFEAIGRQGITIRITENFSAPSKAKYYLRSPDEVYAFLKKVMAIRQNRGD